MQRIMPRNKIIVVGSQVREIRRKGEAVEAFCLRMAREKAVNAWEKYGNKSRGIYAVIGADTVVLYRGEIIGQPRDTDDAIRILRKLSGRGHDVVTGVAIYSTVSARFTTFVVRSRVWMNTLTERTIADYVATGEPLDKAGAYAIQGMGRRLVARYEGSYSNIVGLPVSELRKALRALQ